MTIQCDSVHWNEMALFPAYRLGLSLSLRHQMSIYDDTVGLESFLQKTLHISQHLTVCHTEGPLSTAASPVTSPPAPEPMQIDCYHLSQTEQARRVSLGLWLYCGSSHHL